MLSIVMGLCSFAWAFVYVGLPFHIERITTVGPAATLAWTGWILGITSLAAVGSTPLWGRYAARRDPKQACVLVQLLQALGFLATGLARSLLELFLARLALGVMGSASTFAFILASRSRDPGELRRRLAAVQAAMTAGTVAGPLVGAIAAARLGFRTTFALGGVILLGCAGLLHWGLPAPEEADAPARSTRRMPLPVVAVASALVLIGSIQEGFLAAILPRVLPGLGVAPADTLEMGGMLVFVSGAAAAIGGLAAPHLPGLGPERRVLEGLLAGSSVTLLALGVARSLWLFTVIRIGQALLVAPLFTLVVARVARLRSADAIGVVNAARLAGYFLGPVLATSLLAWGGPGLVYLMLGLAGLGGLALTRR
jgi:MFS family permease